MLPRGTALVPLQPLLQGVELRGRRSRGSLGRRRLLLTSLSRSCRNNWRRRRRLQRRRIWRRTHGLPLDFVLPLVVHDLRRELLRNSRHIARNVRHLARELVEVATEKHLLEEQRGWCCWGAVRLVERIDGRTSSRGCWEGGAEQSFEIVFFLQIDYICAKFATISHGTFPQYIEGGVTPP